MYCNSSSLVQLQDQKQLTQNIIPHIYNKFFQQSSKNPSIKHGFLHHLRAKCFGYAVARLIQSSFIMPDEFDEAFNKNDKKYTDNVKNYLKNNYCELVSIALLLHDTGRPTDQDEQICGK